MINTLRRKVTQALAEKDEAGVNLNQANVALTAGNFDLATEFANRVLNSKRVSKKSALAAELVLIEVRSRQGLFAAVLDQLDSLFRRVPKRNTELQAHVGNEIIRVCYRSGNLGIGALKGEEMLRDIAPYWSKVEVVELLCQLASCHIHRGDTARAEELVSRALGLADNAESAKARAQVQWQSSGLSINRGDLSLAFKQVTEAQHWAQVAGLEHVIPILNNNAALIMLDLPNVDLDHVHRLAETAYLGMSSQNNPSGAAYACEILSEVALRRDDYATALMYAKKGLSELAPEIPGPRTALLVQVAKVLARMGDYEDAKFELVHATDHMEQLEPSRELAKQWGDIARVFVEVGLADRGVYSYERAIQLSGLLREEQDTRVN